MQEIKVKGIPMTLTEFSIYIGVSRQQIYNYLKNYNFDEIVKYKKKNDLTIQQAMKASRRSYNFQNKEQIISGVVKKEQELTYKLKENQKKIDRTIKLIDNLIKNYYKGDYCLRDLEEIKKELS